MLTPNPNECNSSLTSVTVVCMVYLELRWDFFSNFTINMILIALMCARIPSGPDNFKRIIKYQTVQTLFYESIANIVFSFKTNFGWRSI